ncbi:MAG: hypothetical protein ACXVZN_12350, partial [Gaiellaceae bacterium]
MRSSSVAAVSVAAAVLGGAVALAAGRATGWLTSRTTTLVVPAAPAAPADVAPVVVAKPLAGNGFAPAQIYRARSAGVVTVISHFPGSGGSTTASQGSGFVVSRSGTILTSAHVITTAGSGTSGAAKPARQVYVEFSD